ncbi:hypothetical protein F4804DRAFT_306666 [Jackrogersella minutella]|nr:hypothetical protein F4804DRAFT_306666 [Jackrogersella minutella]
MQVIHPTKTKGRNRGTENNLLRKAKQAVKAGGGVFVLCPHCEGNGFLNARMAAEEIEPASQDNCSVGLAHSSPALQTVPRTQHPGAIDRALGENPHQGLKSSAENPGVILSPSSVVHMPNTHQGPTHFNQGYRTGPQYLPHTTTPSAMGNVNSYDGVQGTFEPDQTFQMPGIGNGINNPIDHRPQSRQQFNTAGGQVRQLSTLPHSHPALKRAQFAPKTRSPMSSQLLETPMRVGEKTTQMTPSIFSGYNHTMPKPAHLQADTLKKNWQTTPIPTSHPFQWQGTTARNTNMTVQPGGGNAPSQIAEPSIHERPLERARPNSLLEIEGLDDGGGNIGLSRCSSAGEQPAAKRPRTAVSGSDNVDMEGNDVYPTPTMPASEPQPTVESNMDYLPNDSSLDGTGVDFNFDFDRLDPSLFEPNNIFNGDQNYGYEVIDPGLLSTLAESPNVNNFNENIDLFQFYNEN